ncbi:translation initiation factor [Cronobacter phage vB_CsaM_GAP32]|uniref:Translation initiation factor IF-3 n=1 Tax=Cronobacter phage vB_CsaM_GAP32 TaxID=1141136 RepID=K4F6Y6_9CAUD|nr:translation initiation factor [Cronobacter phage vB_CsaM_GAP32]AFC21763.1 translation initiation factor IF-3 [Cronobacter phage vB_CsaM_GAP32]
MKSVIANEKITAKNVRVVEEGSSQVMAIAAALNLAYSKEMDLIQVSDQDIPVVKIMDLNKYLYEQKQAEKSNKKKQRETAIQVKEVQIAYNTQDNDLGTKAKSAQKFISEGKHVRIVMKMQGRAHSNPSVIQTNIQKMNEFVARLNETDFVQNIAVQGNNITCTVKAK